MFSPSAKPAKVGAARPTFRVCYLCGQQFGSASIGIHIPQCYQKKLAQWQKADAGVRGPKPKNPDTVNWKGGAGATAEQINEEQYETFNSQLVPCPNCGRTFLPDRLPVHLRGCKGKADGASGSGGASASASSPTSRTAKPSAATAPSRVTAKSASGSKLRASASARRSPSSGPPLLPTCYLCGQQFGTASIGIHVPQCYEKKLSQWKAADPRTRGQPPKNPDSVNWRGRPDATAHEQAAEQFQEFMNNLDPCPNCGRKFLPDRLAVHLRSCRPGNTAKPPPTRSPTTAAPPTAATAAAEAPAAAASRPRSAKSTGDGDERLDPKRNRLSRSSPVPVEGRACAQCGVVEYDADAKFCRECGTALDASKQPVPCVHCGERIPQGSRFCGTCGQPVNGAAAAERLAGGTNVNAAAVRAAVCPACEAVCDADGNFCDNCGAALGDTEEMPPSSSAPQSASQTRTSTSSTGGGARKSITQPTKFCPTCKTPVADLAATFCEDCGSRLETVQAPATADGGPPSSAASTLPPEDVARLSAASKKTAPAAAGTTVKAAAVAPKTVRFESPVREPSAAASPPPAASDPPEYADEEGDAVAQERVPCSHCGRRFAPAALARHENICANQKNRRVFNAAKQRQSEDAPPVNPKAAKKQAAAAEAAAAAAPKHDWKAESEAFRRALREARQVDQVLKAGGTAKDLPPPTYSVNPDYVQCPHCQRRFAPEVAKRHIPHCATTVNKPKPPPRRR